MREYETLFVMRPRTSDKEVEDLKARIGKLAGDHEGQLVLHQSLGRKALPFPMQKEKEGIYIHVDYTGNNKVVSEMETILRHDERIIRFMTTVTKKN